MIYKYMLVHPKPGMSDADFFQYWAVKHAPLGKAIPQVRDYIIYERVPVSLLPAEDAFTGCAEIWINSVADEMAFIQSDQYVLGAHRDEPNFLAFWSMVGLDTTPATVIGAPASGGTHVKLFLFHRRRAGVPLPAYRAYALQVHAPLLAQLPDVLGYHECQTVDDFYAIGEALLDGVSVLWFADVAAVETALASPEYAAVVDDRDRFIDTKRLLAFAAREVRISGTEEL